MAVPLFEDLARGHNLEPEPTNGGFLHVPSFRKGHPSYPCWASNWLGRAPGKFGLGTKKGWISEQKLGLLVNFASCSCIVSWLLHLLSWRIYFLRRTMYCSQLKPFTLIPLAVQEDSSQSVQCSHSSSEGQQIGCSVLILSWRNCEHEHRFLSEVGPFFEVTLV